MGVRPILNPLKTKRLKLYHSYMLSIFQYFESKWLILLIALFQPVQYNSYSYIDKEKIWKMKT